MQSSLVMKTLIMFWCNNVFMYLFQSEICCNWIKEHLIDSFKTSGIFKINIIKILLCLQSTWVKKASMKLFSVQISKSWLDCTVEMEQGLGSVSDGTLTLQFMLKQKPKVLEIKLMIMISAVTLNTL